MSELFPDSHSGGSHEHGGKKAKVFGMPPWALGLLGAGLVLVVIMLQRRKAGGGKGAGIAPGSAASGAAPLAYDDPNQPDPNSPTGETYAQEGYTTPSAVDSYLAGSGSPSTGPVGLTPQGLPPPSTNTQWASLVADYLIGQGDDPTLVTNAIQAFLNGQPLSEAQQAIVDLALRQFGEPPQGLIPIASTPPASPPDTGPPAPPPGQTLPPIPDFHGQHYSKLATWLTANGYTVTSITQNGKEVSPGWAWGQNVVSYTAYGDKVRVGLQ